MNKSDLSKKARSLGLTEREELFCYELTKNNGQKQKAAIEAGYKKKSAHVTASRILKKDAVQEFLACIRGEVAGEAVASAQEILERYTRIVRADPNELVRNVVHCCRYCWGKDHMYQWTPAEYREASAEWERRQKRAEKAGNEVDGSEAPDPSGGIDYNRTLVPHPHCPECNGLGVVDPQALDTRDLSDEAKELFAGVKQTQHGIEIVMRSKDKALYDLARHHNLFENDNKSSGEIHIHMSEKDAKL